MKELTLCTVPAIKEAILSLGIELEEAEAIGVMGSLARGSLGKHSDIDIFVVVNEKRSGIDVDRIWWKRIRDALTEFRRDVTVITYSVKGLKNVSNWYVLRLASEGVLIYDKGGIENLLDKIIRTAREKGLVERRVGNQRVWSAKDLKFGEKIVLKIEE